MELWEKLPDETADQYAAFEIYRRLKPSERTIRKVMIAKGIKTQDKLSKWSAQYRWVSRSNAWDEELARVERMATKEAHKEMARRHASLSLTMLTKVAKRLSNLDPSELRPKDIVEFTKAATHLERMSRGDLEERSEANAPETDVSDEWRNKFVQPEGSFLPHKLQRQAIISESRYVVLVAGVQSGKTAGSGIAFWRRVLDEREALKAKGDVGFYWLIAPNSIVGEVMCEAFEQFAPKGEIVKATGQKSGRTWELRDGTRVQFRSAEKADKLVGRRVHGAWLDEFTLLNREVWVTSVRQRLATTSGWAIFSGTPRGRNWAWEEVWRRTISTDDKADKDYAGFTWHSKENPAINPEEVESAKRQLPPTYFRREWEASWESFHGQVYESWLPAKHHIDISHSQLMRLPASKVVIGVDWGFATPGAAVVARELADGSWQVIEEVQEQGRLPEWWVRTIADLWKRHRASIIWCDPEDAARVATLSSEGLPAKKANNDVHRGIRYIASLMQRDMLLVDRSCKVLAGQLTDYHWKESHGGRRAEDPVKDNDHLCDAMRYAIYSTARRSKRGVGGRVTYGGNKIG